MDISLLLRRLGFGKNAGAIYKTLAQSKNALTVSRIAAMANIGRPEAYRNLKKLLAHAYVKKQKIGKRTHYSAESPRRIEQHFHGDLNDAQTLIAGLVQIRQKELPDYVQYLRGPQGIRAVFDDVIAHTPRGSTFYRYTSERDLAAVNRYLSPGYRAKRDKKKLERLVISNPVSGQQKRPRLERFVKFFPPKEDLFEQNIIQLIYGDRLALIDLNTEEAFIIENKTLAQFQMAIFNQLYKKL